MRGFVAFVYNFRVELCKHTYALYIQCNVSLILCCFTEWISLLRFVITVDVAANVKALLESVPVPVRQPGMVHSLNICKFLESVVAVIACI
jgi:hypothetical protein